NSNSLVELERMSQDTQFVHNLVDLFTQDSSTLLAKIEDTLLNGRWDELKVHTHALTGSSLNLGAERLATHCKKIGKLSSPELSATCEALAAETRTLITQTQTALADYIKARGGVMNG